MADLINDWVLATTLPPTGLPVLAHVVGFRNESGVVLRASYWPERTLEFGGEPGYGETDPETGEEWSPAGWYETPEVECPDCGECYYAHIAGSGGKVTHWMPLPAKPEAPHAEA